MFRGRFATGLQSLPRRDLRGLRGAQRGASEAPGGTRGVPLRYFVD